jgi:tetratricopeptide (TPR) repeat protein
MHDDQLSNPSLSPAQERIAQMIEGHALAACGERGGRILFLAGETGSGKSQLLRVTAARLSHRPETFGIATGGLREDKATSKDRKWLERADALISGAASVASALDPGLSLVGPIARLSIAAAGVLEALAPGLTSAELLTRMLRAATRNTAGRPLICLVDDANWLRGTWWTELQFSFAREIAEELSLVLVLAVEGDPHLPDDPGEEDPPPQRVARSLVARNLAEWIALDGLSVSELNEWLGPSHRTPVRALRDLTGGRSGDALELWRSWIADEVLTESDSGWQLNRPAGLEHDALTKLAALVDGALPESPSSVRELAREVLACGALEGRSFTAAAVADAIGRDRETVEDLLDELVADSPEEGVLREPRSVEVHDLGRTNAWTLWRYEFASPFLWRGARSRLPDLPADTAMRLIDSLRKAYGHEIPAIAPAIARLAEMTGRAALIANYRGLVKVPSRMALEAQARYLLHESSDDWTLADHRDASYVFSETALGLCFYRPNDTLLPFAERALDHASTAMQQGRRALTLALFAKAKLNLRLGQIDLAQEALLLARDNSAVGEPGLLANVLCELAEIARSQKDDIGEARTLVKEAALLYRRVDNAVGEAVCKYELGLIAQHEGDMALARALNEEAIAITRGTGDRPREMTMQFQQAEIEYQDGNLDLARELVQGALEYQAATGKVFSEAACLALLARIETTRGNPTTAKAPAESALSLQRQLHDRPAEADALRTLAEVASAMNERDRARQLFIEAQAAYLEIGNAWYAERMGQRLASFDGQ